MVYLIAGLALIATMLGGLFALRFRDHLHLILGFSAGAVLGVAFFDLLPEALRLANRYSADTVAIFIASGFLALLAIDRFLTIHAHHEEGDGRQHAGVLGAATLSAHSFLDGLGIGLAWRVSPGIGLVVAAAVLAHDFSDGINTVNYVLKSDGNMNAARRWLTIDGLAPILGVAVAALIRVTDAELGLILAVFAGFFLYIGASDLLPESHHRHPAYATTLMTLLGALTLYAVIALLAG